MSKSFDRDYEESARAIGLRKFLITLPEGRAGYTWERFRDMTEEELEVARPRPGRAGKAPGVGTLDRSSRLKPTAVKGSGKPLDETANWGDIFRIIDSPGDQIIPRGAKNEQLPPNIADSSLGRQELPPSNCWPEVDLTAYDHEILQYSSTWETSEGSTEANTEPSEDCAP